MLKVTFPHLGNFYIPCKALLSELGLEPVPPPLISQRTMALGTKIAPEFACLPLKINLGNFIEAIDNGAECILMAGGSGPCRFGYYGEVQREILKDAGYNIEFLVFEAPDKHPLELWSKIKRIIPRHTLCRIMKGLYIFWLKAKAIDKFDCLVNKIRPVEQSQGTTTRLQNNFYHLVDNAASVADIKTVLNRSITELKEISLKQADISLKIILLGEIYMVLEPRVNFQIERKLGEMGVEVKRSIYLSDWIHEHLWVNFLKPDWYKQLQLLAEPYLGNSVGGHGLETVAHTVEAGVNHFHGAIELAPFTCMPEIVAMQVLPAISKELSIPVLTIIIDEHSAEAGIATRLEAFIDLLKYRGKRFLVNDNSNP
jgi:predicted nucleotide-binding protein (sugar kinase/HSP70/actin superfamily)